MYKQKYKQGDAMPETKIRRWGNSYGVIISKKIMEEGHLKEGDSVIITNIIKKTSLQSIFGSAKTGESGQAFKDRVRKGWQ